MYKKDGEFSEDEEKRRTEEGYSERKWEETGEEFLASIDIAISESGVDRQKLLEYNTALFDSGHHSCDPKIEKILFLPIYIKLREMGYTHADLIR